MQLKKQLPGIVGLAFIAGMMIVPIDSNAGWVDYMGGPGTSRQIGFSSIVANLPYQELSTEEEVGLLKMREEEKLARDVYQVLWEKWGLAVFNLIAQSEQRHMDAIKSLIVRYNLPDPVADSSLGVFEDHELQELYYSLVEEGQQSILAALRVGATIEDLDINDLYELIEETDNKDIQVVYQNLAKGSRNHLRAFISLLSLDGIIYEAQFLTHEQIDNIVTSAKERGKVDENNNLMTGYRSGRR